MRPLADILPDATAVYQGDITVAHVGASHVVTASGPHRAPDVQAALPDITHDGPPEGRPLWLGGFAFDADHTPTDAWTGYPSAYFQLPARQYCWRDGTLYETTCDEVVPSTAAAPAQILPTSAAGDWHQDVATICEAIRDGDVTKVVLSRTATAPATDPVASFQAIPESDGIGFFFRLGGTFFGRTPERLVRLRDGQVTTHALAGSAARAGDAVADADIAQRLSASGKDVLEHELVVAFVRERLVEAGVQGVHQSPRRLRALRHVQHLETPIHGRASGHILDLVSYLHPTPAVCGTPRSRALDMIRRMERHQRGWYTGTVGYFSTDGEGEFAVALRCALQTSERTLFAGAGIVAGSEPEAEWRETETKLAAMREAA